LFLFSVFPVYFILFCLFDFILVHSFWLAIGIVGSAFALSWVQIRNKSSKLFY